MADAQNETARVEKCVQDPFHKDSLSLRLNSPTYEVRFSNVCPFELSRLSTENAKHISTVKLSTGSGAHHVSMVNGELWIPVQQKNQASMHVFSPSGELVGKFDLPLAVCMIRAVIPTVLVPSDTSQTQVAALACDSGVYTITPGGQIVQTLSDEECSDLCIYNGKLYTLAHAQKKIIVFRRDSADWTKEREISVNYTGNPRSLDTLHISNERLFVCSWYKHRVCVFTMDGGKVAEHGSAGGAGAVEAGKLWGPFLCGCDVTCCMLVCDCFNLRVQLLSAAGTWSVTTLDKYQPRYAVPVDERSFWILDWGNAFHLYQFYH